MNCAKRMWSGYMQFGSMPGVGSSVNRKWRIVEVGRWKESGYGVNSEIINLDRRMDLRCAGTSFLSEEIVGWIHMVSLGCASGVLGYNTSTWYCIDSLPISGWLDMYCAQSVSGKSRSWNQFSYAIDCRLLNIVDLVNILNSFTIKMSVVLKIKK
jgi:hypothetical protein